MNILTDGHVLTFADRCAGRIRLDRPKALHSLDLAMVRGMTRALLEWRDDDDVRIVMIDHAGGRGFCAGGDVVTIAKDVVESAGTAGRDFFFEEYRLNHLMYTYPSPAWCSWTASSWAAGSASPARAAIAS